MVPTGAASTPVATLRFLPGQVLPFHVAPVGRQFVLRNAGSAPLVLIELTLAPGESSRTATGTPVAERSSDDG